MNDKKDMSPTCINSAIDEMEFCIKGARDGYLTNQWICDFISRPLFGIQLWRTNHLGFEIRGVKSPSLTDGLEAFVKEVEGAIPVWRRMIKILPEKTEEAND